MTNTETKTNNPPKKKAANIYFNIKILRDTDVHWRKKLLIF